MATESTKISILRILSVVLTSNTKDITTNVGVSRVTAGALLQELLEDGYLSAKTADRSILFLIIIILL